MASDTQNNRQQERKKVHWRAFVLLSDGTKLPGHIINVSDGGMCFLSPRTFPVNSTLSIAVGVPLPSDASKVSIVNVNTTVCYAVLSGPSFQLGLRFNDLDDGGKRRIREATHKR